MSHPRWVWWLIDRRSIREISRMRAGGVTEGGRSREARARIPEGAQEVTEGGRCHEAWAFKPAIAVSPGEFAVSPKYSG
jgi:hypothetical protein